MHTDGHERIAELVNWALSEAFPWEDLKAGSTDPDTKLLGVGYVGDLSKHHYDPGGPGTGRYHGADTISDVVVRGCKIARDHWLAKETTVAAFKFGVATHFFMDGFICSPSVDKNRHQRGDYAFGRAVNRLIPKRVEPSRDEEYCRAYLAKQIYAVQDRFGQTNDRDIEVAYQTLVRLGQAVTAPNVPASLMERSSAMIRQLDHQLKSKDVELAKFFMAENLELMATVSDVARPLLDAGRIAWFCLAVTLYGRGGEFSRPWLACWVSARFERKIRRLVERPFRDAIQHHRGLVNEAVQKSSQLAPGCDSQWYHTAMLIDNHGSKCKIRASRHANEFAELGKRQHVKAERAVRAWEENWIQDGLFRRWPDSFADRIAESRGVRGLLCAGPVALALIIGGASLAHGPLTWVLILCVLLILFASLAWRTCRICTKISAKIWRRGKITCPICHRASVVETFPGEATVDCPACGANNVRVNFRKSQM